MMYSARCANIAVYDALLRQFCALHPELYGEVSIGPVCPGFDNIDWVKLIPGSYDQHGCPVYHTGYLGGWAKQQFLGLDFAVQVHYINDAITLRMVGNRHSLRDLAIRCPALADLIKSTAKIECYGTTHPDWHPLDTAESRGGR